MIFDVRFLIVLRLAIFVIRKGETFQMIAIGQEGGCRIRVEKREYEVSSCPWLDGFADHQTSVFEIVGRR